MKSTRTNRLGSYVSGTRLCVHMCVCAHVRMCSVKMRGLLSIPTPHEPLP